MFFLPFWALQSDVAVNSNPVFYNRKGDQPPAVRPEGSAAIVRGQLLPIHRLFDHSPLQQGGGVDRLLQAGVSVPLTGAFSPVTHAYTAGFSTQEHPICAPAAKLRRHKQFSTRVPLVLVLFPRSSAAPLHLKP